MSGALARLLNKSEKEVAKAVEGLEQLTGYRSADIRFLEKNRAAIAQKISQLNLDSADTTAEELFHALRTRYLEDSQTFAKSVGSESEQNLPRVTDVLHEFMEKYPQIALKPTTAKKIITGLPPKKLMKQLHYRTISSMVKREEVGKLFMLSQFNESATWQQKFNKQLKTLDSTSFVQRTVNFYELKTELREPLIDGWTASVGMSQSPDSNSLEVCLRLLQAAEKLTGRNLVDKFCASHQCLMWWTGTSHLLSHDGQVSLNIIDVARGAQTHQPSLENGQKSLWRSLLSEYRKYSDKVDELVENRPVELPVKQLAYEYSEVEP